MSRSVRGVTSEIRKALQLSANLLRTAPPRRLEAVNNEIPCLIFTDGAFESGTASCGAVVLSPRTDSPLAFGFKVPPKIVVEWQGFGHEHVIAQAEMLPIVIIKRHFPQLLRGARVLFFIDNEGVKEALVAGATKSEACRKMLTEAVIQDANNNSLNWYTRVPSPSNTIEAEVGLLDYVKVEVDLDYERWGQIRVV